MGPLLFANKVCDHRLILMYTTADFFYRCYLVLLVKDAKNEDNKIY